MSCAIHVGRLRARLDFDAVADPPRESRLGFDVGVLNESSFVLAYTTKIVRSCQTHARHLRETTRP